MLFRRYKREQMEELQAEKKKIAEERRQSAEMMKELQALRMGNTTYVIGVHFSKESKGTLEDKMKRLMREEVKTGSFQVENNL